ncbi:hypothetical protein BC829DRAFT_269947 [Chytridium lagenaria]|nr:hypothetical protein BC829DRAFT_269947 [Chytridium lagenaria]
MESLDFLGIPQEHWNLGNASNDSTAAVVAAGLDESGVPMVMPWEELGACSEPSSYGSFDSRYSLEAPETVNGDDLQLIEGLPSSNDAAAAVAAAAAAIEGLPTDFCQTIEDVAWPATASVSSPEEGTLSPTETTDAVDDLLDLVDYDGIGGEGCGDDSLDPDRTLCVDSRFETPTPEGVGERPGFLLDEWKTNVVEDYKLTFLHDFHPTTTASAMSVAAAAVSAELYGDGGKILVDPVHHVSVNSVKTPLRSGRKARHLEVITIEKVNVGEAGETMEPGPARVKVLKKRVVEDDGDRDVGKTDSAVDVQGGGLEGLSPKQEAVDVGSASRAAGRPRKKIVCEEPGCSKTYVSPAGLRYHLLNHHQQTRKQPAKRGARIVKKRRVDEDDDFE